MTNPDVSGIVKLSSIPIGTSSKIVAAIAPNNPTTGLILITRIETKKQIIKQAKLPSKLFPEKIFILPHFFPMIAANKSPRTKNVMEATAIS
tara:strand:- start:115 stop:390 length:276 start_codon:yes stop_codon:yes gene_type:complete